MKYLPRYGENKDWRAGKLIESARQESQDLPGQMTVDEAKTGLEASEKRLANGEYVTEEEMEDFYRTLQ